MAGYPPPPYTGTPYGYDPKQERRYAKQQMRAQAEAQRAAFRAQRDLYRQQARSMRRSSILGPLLVVTAGVVLLLLRWGRLSHEGFANWYSNWWPALLVFAGVVLVVEWAVDQQLRPEGQPYVRRGVGGGTVLLLLLLAVGGMLATGFRDGRDVWAHGFSINPDNVDEFFGEKHETSQVVEEEFPAGSVLLLDNPRGDVTVTGESEDGKLHMTVNKQMWVHSDDTANDKSDELSPKVLREGSTLTITVPAVRGAAADVTISMPASGGLTINSNRGQVSVAGMKAPVNLTSNHGDVQVRELGSGVTAHVNHNDSSFSAHGVVGDVTVRGHAQDLNVTDVKGQVSLEGEFFGETHLEKVDGGVNFRTNRTQFSLAKLAGEVDISPNSELTGSEITGPTRLKTSSRNIAFNHIAGDVDVNNSHGRVELSSASPVGNVTVENRDGAVEVTLPEHAGVTLDAETRGGSIENELGLTSSSQNDRTSLRGAVGDGAAKVTLRTNHFDIEIKRSAEVPVAPPPPPVPIVPTPTVPKKPVRAAAAGAVKISLQQ